MFGTSKKVLNTLLDEKYDEIAQLKVENQRLKKEIKEIEIANQNQKTIESKLIEYLSKELYPQNSLLKIARKENFYLAVFVKPTGTIHGKRVTLVLKKFSSGQSFNREIGSLGLILSYKSNSSFIEYLETHIHQHGYGSLLLETCIEYCGSLGKENIYGEISLYDYNRAVKSYPQGKYGEVLVKFYRQHRFQIFDNEKKGGKIIKYDLLRNGNF